MFLSLFSTFFSALKLIKYSTTVSGLLRRISSTCHHQATPRPRRSLSRRRLHHRQSPHYASHHRRPDPLRKPPTDKHHLPSRRRHRHHRRQEMGRRRQGGGCRTEIRARPVRARMGSSQVVQPEASRRCQFCARRRQFQRGQLSPA